MPTIAGENPRKEVGAVSNTAPTSFTNDDVRAANAHRQHNATGEGQRWLEEAKRHATLSVVVRELPQLRWSREDRRLVECPLCGASKAKRSHRKHGAVGVWLRDGRWQCFACDAQGSALDLVCAVQWGVKLEGPEVWRQLRRWCAERGWCSPPPGEDVARVELRPAAPAPATRYVTPEQLEKLWESCDTMLSDDVLEWLHSRGIDRWLVEDKQLVRSLPPFVPGWARRWLELDAHCIVALWGPDGALASLQARRCVAQGEKPKALAPVVEGSGVMANADARALLRGEAQPGVSADCPLLVFICEGEIDWLHRATWAGESEGAPAIFGIPGVDQWPRWLADRIPDGAAVYVDVQADEGGELLLQKVVRDLGQRCPIRRLRPLGGAA